MLALTAALGIVEKLLAIHLERLKNLSPEQAAAYWERYEKRMDFWERVIERIKD